MKLEPQGLCLVDWGRGIDLNQFPSTTQFTGDCRTSGFRCIEMKENKPWKFQAQSNFFNPIEEFVIELSRLMERVLYRWTLMDSV